MCASNKLFLVCVLQGVEKAEDLFTFIPSTFYALRISNFYFGILRAIYVRSLVIYELSCAIESVLRILIFSQSSGKFSQCVRSRSGDIFVVRAAGSAYFLHRVKMCSLLC